MQRNGCATGNRLGMSADVIQLCKCAGIDEQAEEIVPTKRLLESDHGVVVRGDLHKDKYQTTRVGGKRHKSRKQRKSRKRRKSHRRKSLKRRKSHRRRR